MQRRMLIHVLSELLNHANRSNSCLMICSEGVCVMVYARIPLLISERFPVGSPRVDLLQWMDIFAESSLCIYWSWKEFKNGVLLPFPAWKEC